MNMNNITIEKATEIIKTLAKQHGVSEENIRCEIKQAMIAGMSNSDSQIQELWRSIPSAGETLTPQELLVWAVSIIIKMPPSCS